MLLHSPLEILTEVFDRMDSAKISFGNHGHDSRLVASVFVTMLKLWV